MNRLLMFLMLAASLAGALAAPARAAPYWVAYEGNDIPENEGWWRVYSGGGANRWIEDGSLVLDGSADLAINDLYRYNQYPMDPEPGELFVAEWRFSIDEIISGPDPGIGLFSDDSWAVGFSFSDDCVRSEFEDVWTPFEFDGFHELRLTSWDMRNYRLEVDGEALCGGAFLPVISASVIAWGDSIQGGASLTRWDYFRFGVVPEPTMRWCVGGGIAALTASRRMK